MDSSSTNCPLCRSANVAAFSAVAHDLPGSNERLSLRECFECGLAWQYPRLRSVEQSVHRHTSQYETQTEGSYYDPQKRRAVAAVELDFVESFFDRPATLLDIGAGDGAFIDLAGSRGWRCIGIDPSARHNRCFTRDSDTVRLIQGTLGDLPPQQGFDVVTMWDVIEHLDNPEAVLRAAAPFLNDTGVLIVETGNFQSAERILAGRHWWAYAADHRWYFSPLNAARLLRMAGYEHCELAKNVLRPGWRGRHSYTAPSWSRRLRRLVRKPLSLLNAVDQWKLLTTAEREWSQWAGLGIFTIAASRHPLRARKETLVSFPLLEKARARPTLSRDRLRAPPVSIHVK